MAESLSPILNFIFQVLRNLPWHWLIIGMHVFMAPATAIHAMLYKRDSRAALGWVSVCIFFPVVGPFIYYLFGINRIHTQARRLLAPRLLRLQVGYERGSVRAPLTLAEPASQTQFQRFGRISERLTAQPLVGGNAVALLQNGEQAYPAMIEAIDAARGFVYLTTYIFETDATGREIIDALARAKRRGVDIRVIVDGVGALYSFPRASRLLRKHGISVLRFLPPRLMPPTLYVNLRNHRKILVVDGELGFTGGMNLGGRHMVGLGGRKCTADIHFKVQGPVVQQLQDNFVSDWKFITGESLVQDAASVIAANLIEPVTAEQADCWCRCISDGPNEDLDQISMAIKTAIATALKSVVVLTPYFLPTREMVAVFQSAALRGVDITIILPQKSNLRFVDWATRNLLWELLQYDIAVLYQPEPFAHSKILIVDGYYAQIGSANLDPRSLRLNFELNMEVIGAALLRELCEYVEAIRARSWPVTLAEVDGRPFFSRLRDAFCWLFLPYL